MVKRLSLLLLFFFFTTTNIFSQDYHFSVDKNYSILFINNDGTCTINYEIQFTCDEYTHPIDIVDIGMPNEWYDLKSASAEVDGYALSEIKHSEYVHPGVEVHLGSHQISPGETGTLLFAINAKNMLFPDTEDTAYVSIEFSPAWYGSQFTYGTTALECYFLFPPGVNPEEPRYHEKKFTNAGVDSTGRVWYEFSNPNASPSSQYIFGASFPKKYIPKDAIVRKVRHRFSFGRLIATIFAKLAGSCPCLIIGFFIFITVFGIVNSSKRKMKYLPPALSVEGVGIKRGLTAVESAILLELPLNKVATMILFGAIKKGVLKVKKREPLILEVAKRGKDTPELHDYEKDFMNAIDQNGKVQKRKLRTTFTELIKSVNKKTKGFSRKKTREYYRGILNRAWTEMKGANTPELKGEVFDKNLGWLMMDKDYKDKMNNTFSGTNIVAPIWWGHYSPAYARPLATVSPNAGIGTPNISMPQLPGANFANSMVSGIENFSNRIVGNLTGFQSAVTKATNPVPVSKSSGGGWSSSGGGCACACACAGCACACAGGGR